MPLLKRLALREPCRIAAWRYERVASIPGRCRRRRRGAAQHLFNYDDCRHAIAVIMSPDSVPDLSARRADCTPHRLETAACAAEPRRDAPTTP